VLVIDAVYAHLPLITQMMMLLLDGDPGKNALENALYVSAAVPTVW
jgi:hypothetical protein